MDTQEKKFLTSNWGKSSAKGRVIAFMNPGDVTVRES